MTRWCYIVVMLAACLTASGAEPTQAAEPAVLTLWNRSIVTFRATVEGISPQQRVQNSRKRIDDHLKSGAVMPVAVRDTTIGNTNGILITMGKGVAFGLVEGDLDAESSLTLDEAAARAAARLRESLQARERQQRPAVIARGIGTTLLALPLLMLAIKLILAGREWAIRKLDNRLQLQQWTVIGVNLRPAFASVERATFGALTWALIGAMTYLAVIVVLQAFPYTEPFGDRLGHYLRDQLGRALLAVIEWAPNILGIVAVLFMTRSVSTRIARVIGEVEQGMRTMAWLEREQARATRRIVSGLIWILGLAIAYSLLPWSNNRVFQGMSIVLGLGVSLASAGLVNQWISGVVLLYSRSFRIGDFIKIDDVEGIVTEMGALATKLHTVRREEITVPNAVMTSGKLINYSRLGAEQGALLSVAISIGYDVSWRHVEALLLQAAQATEGVRRDPSPRVLRWELTDFYVQYQLYVHLVKAEYRIIVRSTLNSNILDAFNAAGVQIMSPHFVVQPAKPVIAAAQ